MELLTSNSGVKRCGPDNRRNIIDRPEDFALNRIFTALLMGLLFAAFFFFFRRSRLFLLCEQIVEIVSSVLRQGLLEGFS